MDEKSNNNTISHAAFVDPNVIMGTGNMVMEGAIIRAGVTIGDNNFFGPHCIIGEPAEKIGYFGTPGKVLIGNRNHFSKQVTIDAGTERITVIGSDVIMLKNAHVGHDAVISNGVTLSCNAIIGGHCIIGEKTNFGLGAVCHQRVAVPDGCMIGMNSTITKRSHMKPNTKYVGSPIEPIGINEPR